MNINMELMCILKTVADGTVKPVPMSETWNECYAGDCMFQVGNWQITIFIDVFDWDYIDNVVTPDGRKYDYDSLNSDTEKNSISLLCEFFGEDCFNKVVIAFETAKGKDEK